MKFLNKFLGRTPSHKPTDLKELYKNAEYIEAYAKHTDMRVTADEKEAVGGMWEEMGRLQIEFLKSEGLLPRHSLFDIGCGTLRGGRHFIRYLHAGNYVGVDISEKAIAAARDLIKKEGLTEKDPEIILNKDADLSFSKFTGRRFDYILAQSVFTHLMESHIFECLENINRLMNPVSRFYFTFFESDEPRRLTLKDFAYPFRFFQELAAQNGLVLENISDRYPHPREQKMAVAYLRE